MSDKSSIDYQMYLDYLDGKQDEPKPDLSFEEKPLERFEESEFAPHIPKADKVSEVKESKPLLRFEEEYGEPEKEHHLSKLEEIEKKYHLDHDGEPDNSHIMSDEEFEAKYGKKVKHHQTYEEEKPLERYDEYEKRVEDSEYEDVFSYNSENSATIPDDKYFEAHDEAERELEDEDDFSEPGDGKGGKGKKGKKGKGKKKKWWKILLIILLILGILGSIAYVKRADIIHYVTSKMMEGNNVGKEDTGVMKRLEKGDDKNHGDIFYESSAGDTWSLEGWLDSWQKQEGQLMYNDKVVNVLLIGMDDPAGDEYGRSDSMIIVSIDTINKKLKLTSVWRDSYGLIQVPGIKNVRSAYETHEKINGANFYGGPELTVKTIESMYKCRIDGYVMTTFESFKDLIDAMGGINVDVEEYENEFLTRTAPVSWHAQAGKNVLLDGKEALVYSRIRKLDSDIKRTERQRKVMSAMLKKVGELNTTQLFKTVNKYLEKGYVTTNFSQNDISGLGTKAVFGGWKDFKMEQLTAPISGEVEPENYKYYWGGTYNGAWVWVVDVPKTATDVQKFIYGETFCELNENRHSISEFVSGGIH